MLNWRESTHEKRAMRTPVSTPSRLLTHDRCSPAGEFELDRNGFTLIQHHAAFDSFDDKQAIETDYFEEMRQVMLELTGAVDAMPIPFYQLRSRKPVHFLDAYSLYMHCDFSPNAWQGMVQNACQEV